MDNFEEEDDFDDSFECFIVVFVIFALGVGAFIYILESLR